MPVRSRGSLLAKAATLSGLLLAGLGCHSSPADHDSFAIPNSPGSSSASFFSSRSATPTMNAMANQPVVRYAPAPPAAPVTLQPVPITQSAPQSREVIASSWQPVQRVSAEQTVAGPELQSGPAANVVARSVPSVPARMPVGSPVPGRTTSMQLNNGPIIATDEAMPPGGIVLPPPRPLGSPPPGAVVVHDGPVMPPMHGPYPYPNVPREFEKMALPPYVVEPPDILLIQASDAITSRLQRIEGQHLVAPDGTVNLGIYGKIRVVGMTVDQIADAVAARLLEYLPGLLREQRDEKDPELGKKMSEQWRTSFSSIQLVKRELQVDVLAYNSKFYYVITDGGGWGQQVYPLSITGNETVLDALARVSGLPAVASKKHVWVARATRAGQPPKILPVDWKAITKCGSSDTNYQLFPGDRLYVDSDPLIKTDTILAKIFSPIQRSLGVTLLGASTVNAIKGTPTGGIGAAGIVR